MTAVVAGVRDRLAASAEVHTQDPGSAFVRTHFAFAWRTLRRFGVPEADVADAVQRVFVVATGRLADIAPGREQAFVFGTALRVADKVRRARSRHPPFAESDPDDETSSWPSAEELVDQRRARAVLDAILDGMPEDFRAVFVLYEIEQMTVKDIAALIGVPQGTAASRLRRARELFQDGVRSRKNSRGEAP
jgi:RNA polymerase sigma-70 factor (ECF subfamily)